MSDKQPTLDERRRSAAQPGPTLEEREAQHSERLATLDDPPTPTPTQDEADAMKMGTSQLEPGASPEETEEARIQREQRDMKPETRADYKTR
jgi:hypothetical protein